jgi:hypothetical protein
VSKVGVAYANVDHGGGRVTADLETLLTALYVLADDFLPRRPRARRRPQITHAELVCLAVAQILLDCPSERSDDRSQHERPQQAVDPLAREARAPEPGPLPRSLQGRVQSVVCRNGREDRDPGPDGYERAEGSAGHGERESLRLAGLETP